MNVIDTRNDKNLFNDNLKTRTWVLSAFMAVFLISPMSGSLFNTSFGYLGELPLVVTLMLCMSELKLSNKTAGQIVSSFTYWSLLILPFAFFAIINNIAFTVWYPDLRAILTLVLTLLFLSKIDTEVALDICAKVGYIALFVTAVIAVSSNFGLFTTFFQKSFSGKYFPPIFPVLIICALATYRGVRLIDFFAIIAFSMLATTSSYRQVLIIAVLAIAAIFLTLIRQMFGKAIAWASLLVGLAFLITLAFNAADATGYIYSELMNFSDQLIRFGFPERSVEQVIVKTARSLVGDGGYAGDSLYLTYFANLLNFERFSIPHGLGQGATLGSSVIFEGNTIDNSVIFLNYHFSIWIMLIAVSFYAAWSIKFLTFQFSRSFPSHLPIWLALSLFLYFRAWPFVSIDGAISFAMMLMVPILIRRRAK